MGSNPATPTKRTDSDNQKLKLYYWSLFFIIYSILLIKKKEYLSTSGLNSILDKLGLFVNLKFDVHGLNVILHSMRGEV